MLFAFGVPVILVWWQEKRKSRKVAVQAQAEASSETRTSRSEPVARPSAYDTRIERERERTRQANAPKAPATVQAYSPPKKDYAEIVRAGKSTTPAVAAVAERNQPTRVASSASARSSKSGWVPSNETASVAGRNIGGMVYVGTPPLLNTYGYRDKCRAYIDPSLSVARSGTDKAGDGMPYWPGYSDISPRCRATYLEWLASGRSDASYNPGYMFLYFYGLERRFFVDQSHEDAKDIVQEVRRLQSLHPDNHSVRRYLGEFLDIAMLAETDLDAIEPIFEKQGWELPFSLKYAIGARIDKGENVTADWLLSWFICHPETNLRTPATRCRDEFVALFRMRFDQRFPDGLKVTKPRKSLKASYRAASSEFQGSSNPTVDGKPVPDISGLRKPIEIAQELADEVMNDLDKLSRYLGRNPDGRGSVEAHALLPSELWDAFPSEEMDRLKSWASDIVDGGGLVPLEEVIGRLEGETNEKIGKRQMTGAADALARLGFARQQPALGFRGRQGVVQHIAQAAPGKYRTDFLAQVPALVAALAGQGLVEKSALEAVKADDPDDLLCDVGAVADIGAEAGYRDFYYSFARCPGGEAESLEGGGDLSIFKFDSEVSCNITVADRQRPCFSRLWIAVGDRAGRFCPADFLQEVNSPLDCRDGLRRVDLPAEAGGCIGHQLQLRHGLANRDEVEVG
jgi:hypothetical protein